MDYSPETKKNYDIFLRIGIDGERRVGKSGLIRKFAEDDFRNGTYEETLHVYVTTTHMHIQLDDYNYNVKVEFLETGWNLRPNKIYYNYIDGAILVYDISDADGLEKIKELSREYVNTDCNNVINNFPIMIIANQWDENKQKNRDDLLNEVNNFVGEEFLCDITSIEEKTSTSLEKIIKKCISRLLDFREINDLNVLISSSNQFKPMMKHATQLYFYGVIPKKVIDDRRKEILNEEMDEIKSFLLLK
ncbi:small GTPase [Gigaspora margarita]|uniref:Small GTPase n=1 Tax=Gigaspora margarita TaxID=4874 RepID=A0A8H4AIK2_GIGMA|nr:small GTPase [Gigaspora margarita]